MIDRISRRRITFIARDITRLAGRERPQSDRCQEMPLNVGVWSGAWEGGAVTSVETTVMYRRKDATVTDAIPVTSTLRMRGDLIADFRIFADIAPLFARSGEGGLGEAEATASRRAG